MRERFSSLPSIFGYLALGKETKNTAENVVMKKDLYLRTPLVNKDFVHSGLRRLIWGKHARYVIILYSSILNILGSPFSGKR